MTWVSIYWNFKMFVMAEVLKVNLSTYKVIINQSTDQLVNQYFSHRSVINRVCSLYYSIFFSS